MNKNTVTTGLVRLSYEHIWEPSVPVGGGAEKYSASFIIPKNDKKTIKKIEDAIQEAIEMGKQNKWGGKTPKNLKLPLRDGDEEREDSAYADSLFINANCSATNPPFIVDRDKRPISTVSAVYSGCYVLANVTFYPFDSNGNKGVACGLNGVVFMRDGEPLSSRISVDEALEGIDFDEFDLEDDDDL